MRYTKGTKTNMCVATAVVHLPEMVVVRSRRGVVYGCRLCVLVMDSHVDHRGWEDEVDEDTP